VDAFLNYLTGLGWGGDEKNLPKFWPVDINMIGKDILRVHATIWPAILMHLGIELPKMLFTHGHILSGGKKMSKTLGNVITIDEMLSKFGTDGTRYLLMSGGTFGDDLDLTMERMTEKYNADLANGLGNLVSRVVKLYQGVEGEFDFTKKTNIASEFSKDNIDNFKFDLALRDINILVKVNNEYIEINKPWELVKTDVGKFEKAMEHLILGVACIADYLIPFMPETAEKIKTALETKKVEPLFQRIK
jgi:methionyl-tRNA synthetase